MAYIFISINVHIIAHFRKLYMKSQVKVATKVYLKYSRSLLIWI